MNGVFVLSTLLISAGVCLANNTVGQASAYNVLAELDRSREDLVNIICHTNANRYSVRDGHTRKVETIESELRIIDGADSYSTITLNGHAFHSMHDLPGAWIMGELGFIVDVSRRDIEKLSKAGVIPGRALSPPEAEPLYEVDFFDPEESGWTLYTTKPRGAWTVPFSGKVLISIGTGRLRAIEWRSEHLDTPEEIGISGLTWRVEFKEVEIENRRVLVPSRSLYRVSYSTRSRRTDWIDTRYSDIQRFGANTVLRFNE